jgi:hypothetical protein
VRQTLAKWAGPSSANDGQRVHPAGQLQEPESNLDLIEDNLKSGTRQMAGIIFKKTQVYNI